LIANYIKQSTLFVSYIGGNAVVNSYIRRMQLNWLSIPLK